MHEMSTILHQRVAIHAARVADPDDALILANGKAVAWRPPEGVDFSNPLAALAGKIAITAAEHAAVRVAIEGDHDLSDAGRQKRLAEKDAYFAGRANDEYRAFEAQAIQAEVAMTNLLSPPTLSPGDAVGGLLDREVRDYLASLPLHEKMKAVSEGPVSLAHAVLRSPLPVPEDLRKVATIRHASALPEAQRQALSDSTARSVVVEWARQVASQARDTIVSHARQTEPKIERSA